MRVFHSFPVEDIADFKNQLFLMAAESHYYCCLDGNNYPDYPYSTFESFFAIEALDVCSVSENCLEAMTNFMSLHQDWMFGFISYDLKNEIEPRLQSANLDGIINPMLHFFVPKYLIKIEQNEVQIGITEDKHLNEFRKKVEKKYLTINTLHTAQVDIKNRISKEQYKRTVDELKAHIQRGDIYEINFCQEFYSRPASIDPVTAFHKLNQNSKAPFTSFFKNDDNFLLCASPERFLKRINNKLISQPIKGTRKRSAIEEEDKYIREELYKDEKERSENVMIVDLVRNDLSKIAKKNSVEVEELFGIYSFQQVHQMISTITCSIDDEISFATIIKALFPMGSMTGAPKLSAMQLIEQYEQTQRGLFSGALGYITPQGNFDFNVVIRSILYNQKQHYLSIQTGSAITIECDPEKEYEECLLKAKAMLSALE